MQHYDHELHGAQRTTPHCDLWRLELANGTRFVAVRGQALYSSSTFYSLFRRQCSSSRGCVYTDLDGHQIVVNSSGHASDESGTRSLLTMSPAVPNSAVHHDAVHFRHLQSANGVTLLREMSSQSNQPRVCQSAEPGEFGKLRIQRVDQDLLQTDERGVVRTRGSMHVQLVEMRMCDISIRCMGRAQPRLKLTSARRGQTRDIDSFGARLGRSASHIGERKVVVATYLNSARLDWLSLFCSWLCASSVRSFFVLALDEATCTGAAALGCQSSIECVSLKELPMPSAHADQPFFDERGSLSQAAKRNASKRPTNTSPDSAPNGRASTSANAPAGNSGLQAWSTETNAGYFTMLQAKLYLSLAAVSLGYDIIMADVDVLVVHKDFVPHIVKMHESQPAEPVPPVLGADAGIGEGAKEIKRQGRRRVANEDSSGHGDGGGGGGGGGGGVGGGSGAGGDGGGAGGDGGRKSGTSRGDDFGIGPAGILSLPSTPHTEKHLLISSDARVGSYEARRCPASRAHLQQQSADWVCAGLFSLRASEQATWFLRESIALMAEYSLPDQDAIQALLTGHVQVVRLTSDRNRSLSLYSGTTIPHDGQFNANINPSVARKYRDARRQLGFRWETLPLNQFANGPVMVEWLVEKGAKTFRSSGTIGSSNERSNGGRESKQSKATSDEGDEGESIGTGQFSIWGALAQRRSEVAAPRFGAMLSVHGNCHVKDRLQWAALSRAVPTELQLLQPPRGQCAAPTKR